MPLTPSTEFRILTDFVVTALELTEYFYVLRLIFVVIYMTYQIKCFNKLIKIKILGIWIGPIIANPSAF